MMNTCFDPQFLQQKAQVQLQAALHLNAAVRNHLPSAEPRSNRRHSSSSSQSPEPKRAAGDQTPRIPLHRTSSAPLPSEEINHVQSSNFPVPASTSLSTFLPEEKSGVKSSLPRSSTEPVLESYLPVPASTPPRPPAAGKMTPLPPTPSFREPCGLSPDAKRAKRMQECGLSPDAKRAKRLQERTIQVKKLWEIMKEEEEEEDAATALIRSNGSGSEELCDESVWVERKGEVRILHFKCHCNKAYKILLSGNDCYYKLNCV